MPSAISHSGRACACLRPLCAFNFFSFLTCHGFCYAALTFSPAWTHALLHGGRQASVPHCMPLTMFFSCDGWVHFACLAGRQMHKTTYSIVEEGEANLCLSSDRQRGVCLVLYTFCHIFSCLSVGRTGPQNSIPLLACRQTGSESFSFSAAVLLLLFLGLYDMPWLKGWRRKAYHYQHFTS